MVGANYMGGRRNTARAKSKDVVGRAQKCHFGRQRLASALCVTQESRDFPSLSTPSPVLPGITLAHARCHASIDSGASSPIKFFSENRSYLSTPPSNTAQRNKPSKVLSALDISDHMSMRAAIERILRQPNLIGIRIPNRRGAAYTGPTQIPVAARRPTDAHLHSQDRDIRHPGIVSKHIFGPQASDSRIQRHEFAGLPENGLNKGREPTGSGILSLSNSSLGRWGTASLDGFDDAGYAEVQLSPGTNRIEVQESKPDTSLDAAHPLPRSSPFSSSSQSLENSILDLDTSPWAAIRPERSGSLFGENIDRIDASSPRSIHQPVFRQPSGSSAIREGLTGLGEARFIGSSLTHLIEEELAIEDFWTTRCDDGHALPSAENDDSRHSSSSRSGHGSVRIVTGYEVTEDDARNDILIDFLSDPHPWETIGRILKLKPPELEASATHFVTVNFTKDREGVGYVSLEKPNTCDAHLSYATSSETKINDKPTDDMDLLILDSGVSIVDNRATVDARESLCTGNSAWPLLGVGLPLTNVAEVNVHPVQAGDLCADNEHSLPLTPPTNISGATVAELDIDMTFGPCLFGDSDLEEDE